MANRLAELFDPANKTGRDLVATPPRSLAQMTASGSIDPDALQAKIDILSRVRPKVDYTDFSNFVFFNSALDYFNLSGERIINEWPADGKFSDQLVFQSQSDDYQAWLLTQWPKSSGCIDLGTGYVTVNDPGSEISLSGSAYTIELRVSELNRPASGSARFLMSLVDASGNRSAGIALVSGGLLVASSASSSVISIPSASNYLAVVVSTGGLNCYVAASASSVAWATASAVNLVPSLNSTQLFIGSGSVAGYTTIAPQLKVREARIWNYAKTLSQLQANYNTRVFADPTLLYYGRMNEGYGSVVGDYSGNKLTGSMWTGAGWAPDSLSFSPHDEGELVTNVRDPRLRDFIIVSQASGTTYDRNNVNIITNLVPQQYLYIEDERNTHVLKDLLYTLARQFDEMKVRIDQIPKLLTPSYTGFDEAPDALLGDVLSFWGWDTNGNFLSKEAFQYFFGYNVISGSQAQYDNQRLDVDLYQIKSEFWRRTLQNLSYLYKKKGTREGIESLLRVYGLDEKLVKLKEYGIQPEVGIATRRIHSSKSATYIKLTGTMSVETPDFALPHLDPYSAVSVNMQIRFPTRTEGFQLLTGSIGHSYQGSTTAMAQPLAFPLGQSSASTTDLRVQELRYYRPPGGQQDPVTGQYTDTTGELRMYASVSGSASLVARWQNVPIFDGRWYSLIFTAEPPDLTTYTGTLPAATFELHVSHLDSDRVVDVYDQAGSDVPQPVPIIPGGYGFSLGRHVMANPLWNPTSGSEFSVRNLQIWELYQTTSEMDDHCLNPFSYGADTPERFTKLMLNYQFDQDKDQQSGWKAHDSTYLDGAADGIFYSDYPLTLSTASISASYVRDVFDYNYIATLDYGWNEEKVRSLNGKVADVVSSGGFVVSGSKVVTTPSSDRWDESNVVALEFNLIDALNEDISLMMSTMDNWNNVIGEAANRHRDVYPQLEKFRQQYFTRLTGRINFRAFADFMDFFDRSFVDLVKKMLPARSNFKGAEFVVESHMLERPKVQYTYRRHSPELVPEGDILIYSPAFKSVNTLAPQLQISGSKTVHTGSVSSSFLATTYWIGSTGSQLPVTWSLSGSGTITPSGTTCYLSAAMTTGSLVLTASPVSYPYISATFPVRVV